jgi:hypothetical protein
MALKLVYYGQNDGSTVPDVVLTGDPGTDQATLTAAGFLGGKIVALQTPSLATGLVAIVPCNADSMLPYATLINGPGEFAGAIGPSGSKKAPVVRAMWQGNVNSEAYDAGATFTLGDYLYCGGATGGAGNYTSFARKGTLTTRFALGTPVGICTHVPTAAEPWLGVASLL